MRRITSMMSQWKAQELSGKNLFDISSMPQNPSNISVNKSTVTITNKYANTWTTDVVTLFNNMGIKAGDTITVSRKLTVLEGEITSYITGRINLISKDTTKKSNIVLVEGSENIRTVTLPDDFDINDYQAIFVYGISNGVVELSDIQIEKGSTATPYEPYCGGKKDQLSIESCKGGYFSVTDDYGLKVVGKTKQEELSGKNVCLSLSERTIKNGGDTTNTTQRNFDGKGIYIGLTRNNYYNPNLITDVTIEGETITIDRTGQSSGGYGVGLDIKVEPNTTYAFSDAYVNNVYFGYYTADGVFIGDVYNKKIITTPAECEYMTIIIGYLTDTISTYSNIQLELGSTATSYEPYCGGIPAPNPNYPKEIQCVKAGTEVKVCGKNLIDQEICVSHGAVRQEDGSYYFKHAMTPYRKIIWENTSLTKGQFTVSFDIKFIKNNNIIGCYPMAYYTDGSNAPAWTTTLNTLDDNTWGNFVFSTDKNKIVSHVEWTYGTDNAETYIKNIQFEKGTSATPYVPYIGNEITVPCDLYEGDIWYPMSGRVIRNNYHHICTGDETVSKYSDDLFLLTLDKTMVAKERYNSIKCSHCLSSKINFANNNKNIISMRGSVFGFNADSTVYDVKNWLRDEYNNGTPVIFVYQLETPATEIYEPQPIFAPQGTVNIMQIPVDVSADLSTTVLVRR